MTQPPAEPKADIRSTLSLINIPWVMAALAIALLLGQFLNRAEHPQPVLAWYEDSGLKALEWDNYLSWLRFNGDGELARTLEGQLAGGDRHAYAAALLSDAFVTDSNQRARDFWSAAQVAQWQALRHQVPAQLADSNLYRWGLADSQPRPAHFFTAPFTGGAVWLALLTLLLLAPLAPSLERHLGHGRVLALWLLGSLLAGAGYLLLARPGLTPLHGATAPLLVWYGAFLGLQGRRTPLPVWHPRTRTLVTVPLPTPLLALVPLGLTALLAWQSVTSLPALTAGLAALAGGALLVQVMRPRQTHPEHEDTNTPLPAPVRQRLSEGWDALARLKAETARRAFEEVLTDIPEQFDALTGLFATLQLEDPAGTWETHAHRLFAHPASEKGQATQVAACWKQYQQRGGPPLPADVGWALVTTLTRSGDFQQAETLARELDDHRARKPALKVLREALQREGLNHRAKALEGA
ncbi:MAG: hypothetical protein MI745_01880 [Pseudomonadales bacterium]|nr:hypothetical protein [Pseudomonadales bacterium]